jgi:3-mercaptopyruvate sulfurtransferase SseA
MATGRSPIVTAAELLADATALDATRVYEVTWFPGASEETQADFETGHIADAAQLDVQNDLSVPIGDEAKLNFTRDTSASRLAARLGALGLTSATDSVVLYHRSGESLQSNLTAVSSLVPHLIDRQSASTACDPTLTTGCMYVACVARRTAQGSWEPPARGGP